LANLNSEIFYADNARNEEREQIVKNYVVTEHLWNLFTPRHQIVFGSRGSGKTALMKMASFPYISTFDHPRAHTVTSDFGFLGVHVSTDVRFVGSLQNKIWRNSEQAERYFVWKFNLTCLKAILTTLKQVFFHLFGDSFENYSNERAICDEICKLIFGGSKPVRFDDLVVEIDNYEDGRSRELYLEFLSVDQTKPIDVFGLEIGDPIRMIDRLLKSRIPKFMSAVWLICLDEAEYLTEQQIAILNSFMRSFTKNIFLKIATLPYHYHLQTNLNVPLREEDDVAFVFLDELSYDVNEKAEVHWVEFANRLFISRQSTLGDGLQSVQLAQIVGESQHLAASNRMVHELEDDMKLVMIHCDQATTERAKNILFNPRKKSSFGDQIWRKITSAIALREDVIQSRGQRTMEFYSGVTVLIRCTDGVPRKLINLFRRLATEVEATQQLRTTRSRLALRGHAAKSAGLKKISRKRQTSIAKDIAEQRLERTKSIPKLGPQIYAMTQNLGEYLNHKLHSEQISTDIINCFRFDEKTSDSLHDLIRVGIAHSAFFTVASINRPNKLPEREGIFRLSYALCPKFDLLPRRGKDRLVQKILAGSDRRSRLASQPMLFSNEANDADD
jgi:hypothetical protein